jgi:SPW repeat-containing protein
MTTSRTDDVGTHPDLANLRTHDEPRGAGLSNGLILLAGLYLIVSPWIIQSMGGFGLAANDMIAGLALALLAVGYTRTFDRLHSIAWVTPMIGAWVIVSPWVIYRDAGYLGWTIPSVLPLTTATWLSNVIAGAVVVLAGIRLTSIGGRFRARYTDH